MDDHLVINPENYVSFREIGWMDELAKSTKYIPPYLLKEHLDLQLKESEQKIEEQKVRAEKFKIQIVRSLPNNGMSIDQIAEI